MPNFKVLTSYPVAYESIDHTQPAGTANDNSRNHRFNDKVYTFFQKTPLRFLDLGCAGGGFVKDCIDDGHEAVGLEGSDYSLIRQRAEWSTIPQNLFTCDILKPFSILEDGDRAIFDCITSWEVLEHLTEEGLPTLCDNVLLHLSPSGLWINSISTQIGIHHTLVRDRNWWKDLFLSKGFTYRDDLVFYFGDDWIRGPQQNAPESFHVVLQRPQS